MTCSRATQHATQHCHSGLRETPTWVHVLGPVLSIRSTCTATWGTRKGVEFLYSGRILCGRSVLYECTYRYTVSCAAGKLVGSMGELDWKYVYSMIKSNIQSKQIRLAEASFFPRNALSFVPRPRRSQRCAARAFGEARAAQRRRAAGRRATRGDVSWCPLAGGCQRDLQEHRLSAYTHLL
eukprot:COSAG02_NODE_1626_length_11587_cov_49.302577_4_plen_181_part_00